MSILKNLTGNKTDQYLQNIANNALDVKKISNNINNIDVDIKKITSKGLSNLTVEDVTDLKNLRNNLLVQEFNLKTTKNSLNADKTNSVNTIKDELGNIGFSDLKDKVDETTNNYSDFKSNLAYYGYNDVLSKIDSNNISNVQSKLNEFGLSDLSSSINSIQSGTLNNNLKDLGLTDLKNKVQELGLDKVKQEFNSLGLDDIQGKVDSLGLDKLKETLTNNTAQLEEVKANLINRNLNDVAKSLDIISPESIKNQIDNLKLNDLQKQINSYGLDQTKERLNNLGLTGLSDKLDSLGLDKIDQQISQLALDNITDTLDNAGLRGLNEKVNTFLNNELNTSLNDDLSAKIEKLGLDNVKNELSKLNIPDVEEKINGIKDSLNNQSINSIIGSGTSADDLAMYSSYDAPFLKDSGDYFNNDLTIPKTSSLGNLAETKGILQTSEFANTASIEEKSNISDIEQYLHQQKEFTINGSKSTFSGLKFAQGDNVQATTEALLKWQEEVVKQGDKINGLKAPWDWRLIGTYTSSQSVGNSMPYGPEWQGSPSLMNKLALIRFDHVAGSKHNLMLLDQADSMGMRWANGNTKYLTVKKEDYVTDIDSENNQPGKLNPQKEAELRASSEYKSVLQDAISINADENGQVSYWVEDKSREVWKSADGEEITVNTNSNYKPNQKEYWIEQEGWVECQVPGGEKQWVLANMCPDGKYNAQAVREAASQIDSIRAKASDPNFINGLRANAEAKWKNASYWQNQGFYREQRFLTQTADFGGTKGSQGKLIELEPTTENLCSAGSWKGREQFLYDWSDFLYTTHYDLIPNNQLITLRRFPMPVYDNAKLAGADSTQQYMAPIAKAVTWFDEDIGNRKSELMGFTFGFNWSEIESTVQELQGNEKGINDALGEGGLGGGLMKLFDLKGALNGSGNFSQVSGWDEQRAKFDPYDGGPLANKVYGPVNVISKTQKRERGLNFTQDFKLVFKYSLKSIGGINPKAALLDILANFLALTYNNAAFWGGAIRYFPNKPAYPMTGLKGAQESWYNGDPSGFLDSVIGEISGALGSVGDSLMELFNDPLGALEKIAGGAGKLFMAKKLNQGKPDILKFKSLLTGDPVGEWHLTLGNPFNPAMTIGNLIVTGGTVSFSDAVGVDDFPDEIIMEVNLSHGKPRDKGDIESMFNRGNGRLHYSYFGQDNEAWNLASSTRNSKIDRIPSTGEFDVNGGGKFTGYTGNLPKEFSTDPNAGKAYVNSSQTKIYGTLNKKAISLASKMGFVTGG